MVEIDEMIVDPENMRRLNKMFNIRLKLDTQLDELARQRCVEVGRASKAKARFLTDVVHEKREAELRQKDSEAKLRAIEVANAKWRRRRCLRAMGNQQSEIQRGLRRGCVFGPIVDSFTDASSSMRIPLGVSIGRRATISTGNALHEINARKPRVRRDVPLPTKFVPRNARSMSELKKISSEEYEAMVRRGQSRAVLHERDRAVQKRKVRERGDPRIELQKRLLEAIALTDEDIDLRIQKAGAHAFYLNF